MSMGPLTAGDEPYVPISLSQQILRRHDLSGMGHGIEQFNGLVAQVVAQKRHRDRQRARWLLVGQLLSSTGFASLLGQALARFFHVNAVPGNQWYLD